MKKVLAFLLVAMMALACISFAAAEETAVMSYADFAAAEVDTAVSVVAYVQAAAYNAAYGNVSLFLADADGAYYVYRAACDDELAAKLDVGVQVKVEGFKGEWSGEVEIVDATVTVIDEDFGLLTEGVDITAELGTDALIEKINQRVIVSGAEIVAYNDAGDAFSYGWDGSGQAGANSDLYFNVKVGDAVYSMTVESDEVPEGNVYYTDVTNLKVGDKVDLEGFLYWYEGAQIHVHMISVVD